MKMFLRCFIVVIKIQKELFLACFVNMQDSRLRLCKNLMLCYFTLNFFECCIGLPAVIRICSNPKYLITQSIS